VNQGIPASAKSAAELAFTFAKNGFRKGVSAEAASNLIRKIDTNLDRYIAEAQDRSPGILDCGPTCCFCCYRPIMVSATEAVAIHAFVESNFSSQDKTALYQRLGEYPAHSTAYREHSQRLACPLLNAEQLCSIYAVRPIACRAACSFDAESCRLAAEFPEENAEIPVLDEQAYLGGLASEGLAYGLAQAGVAAGTSELGIVLGELLTRSISAEQVLAADRPSNESAHASYSLRFDPPSQDISEARRLQSLYEFEGVGVGEANNPRQTPAELLARLSLPSIYASEEQITERREFFDSAVADLAANNWNPHEAYQALAILTPFAIVYQGLSVKNSMQQLGGVIVDQISSLALPHLCEPLGVRKPGKLRLGYISTKIRNSNAARWALGWLRHHGPEFETFVFNTGGQEDLVTARFKSAADAYYLIQGDPAQAAEFIKSLDLDILIYPDIGMDGRDYQYASLRLARVQCTGWGNPATSGLPTMDYYLSSELMEPEGAEAEYTETLVRLPRSGLCIPGAAVPRSRRSRDSYGFDPQFQPLMAQHLVKWLPNRDHTLKQLYETSGKPIAFIGRGRREWLDVFRGRMDALDVPFRLLDELSTFDFNRALEVADVSVDSPDWSGGNTSLDAIAMGKPVPTLPGAFMRGRHTCSFHQIAGSTGLSAKDEADFLDIVKSVERQQEALNKAAPEALFDDVAVVEALDHFLIEAVERSS
jgi:Fe-S-cluster containining protein